jgi:hypothetical protein
MLKIYAAKNERLAPILEFLSLTGLRWGKLVALRVSDYHRKPHDYTMVSRSQSLATAAGRSSLIMELERAWLDEFFAARPARDCMDRCTDARAEADRQRDAAAWDEVAMRAISFVGTPLGAGARTPADVAKQLDKFLELAFLC